MKTTIAAVIASLISFVAGSVWILVSAEMFIQYFYEARMVGLTHVFTLGWVSLMIVGVLRQLAPLAFGLPLQQPSLFSAVVVLWIPGLVAMVFGFATLTYALAAVGTSLLFVASMLVLVALMKPLWGVRRDPPHKHLLAALCYFGAAAVLGAWMGLAKALEVPLPASFHRVLFAHIHLAGAGWAGMVILAVMSRLFPQPHLRRPTQARIRFVTFNLGLSGLAAGLLFGGEWYAAGGALLAVACIWYALEFIPILLEFGQPSDRSTAFLIASWSCLAVVAALGLRFSLMPMTPTVFNLQLQFVYGFLYMFGWLSLMIFGMLYRILPTHISKFLATRGFSAAGARRAFIAPGLQVAVLVCLLVGVGVSSVAILIQDSLVFRIGWGIWLTGVIGFISGLVRLGKEVRIILRSVAL